jgi:hypothetical protein
MVTSLREFWICIGKRDGCFLHLEIVRSDQTAAGFEKRQKEHKKPSKLKDEATRQDQSISPFILPSNSGGFS